MTELTPSEFDTLVTTNDMFVIKFWAGWCESCMEADPIIESVASTTEIPFYSVNVDLYPEIKHSARIKAIPAVLFYKERRVRSFLFGNITEDKIKQRLLMLERM